MKRIHVALVGDFNKNKHTHLALNDAVEHARAHINFELITTWFPTENIADPALFRNSFQAVWFTPGSPYKNDEAVYDTIQWVRENNFPALGTCGGFQYMVVEYARNVLDFRDAGHEESEPDVSQLVISKLSCSLKGQQEEVRITDRSSWLYHVLKQDKITGYFNCSYGVNPVYQEKINQYPFVFTAFSPEGEVRGLELKNHPFFKGTLFQPPLESTAEKPNPLLVSFFETVATL
ncbi:MAG TPA: hypothetical protein VGK59_09180 [Ohtaekwangia sp.]